MKPKLASRRSKTVMDLVYALPGPSLETGSFQEIAWKLCLGEQEGAKPSQAPPITHARDDEDPLVNSARKGDEQAFRVLVTRYAPSALTLARRIVGSPEDAEEVASDAFVRAWRALPAFRGDARFSTWLYRIVVNRALAQAATTSRRRANEERMEAETLASLPGPQEGGGSDISRLRLEGLIGRLPEMQRVVVTLFYIQDRSIEDVARVLSMPQGTVKTHLHRARAALRTAWQREADHGGTGHAADTGHGPRWASRGRGGDKE